jgi:hypothetical protein
MWADVRDLVSAEDRQRKHANTRMAIVRSVWQGREIQNI